MRGLKAAPALFCILSVDYLTLNFCFCSRSIVVSPTLVSSFVSGSPSLWPDCTLMSIRAMASPPRAFMERQWKMLTHHVAHAKAAALVGMFVCPDKDAL